MFIKKVNYHVNYHLIYYNLLLFRGIIKLERDIASFAKSIMILSCIFTMLYPVDFTLCRRFHVKRVLSFVCHFIFIKN